MVGIPGCGKSTYVKYHFPGYVRVNLDTLRTRAREARAIESALSEGRNVVVDNTDVTREIRKRYFDFAKRFGASIRAVYLKCSFETARNRNMQREEGRVPEVAIRSMAKKLEPPTTEEGFERVDVIEND